MNPELSREITEILKSMHGFVLEQSPELVKELIRYQLWSSYFWMGIAGGLIIGAILSFMIAWKKSKEWADAIILWLFIGPGLALIGTVIFTYQYQQIYQLQNTPKVFLFEYSARCGK